MHKVSESVVFRLQASGFSPGVNHKAPLTHVGVQLNDQGERLPGKLETTAVLAGAKECWKCFPVAWGY